jgi:hypothetical protein
MLKSDKELLHGDRRHITDRRDELLNHQRYVPMVADVQPAICLVSRNASTASCNG